MVRIMDDEGIEVEVQLSPDVVQGILGTAQPVHAVQ